MLPLPRRFPDAFYLHVVRRQLAESQADSVPPFTAFASPLWHLGVAVLSDGRDRIFFPVAPAESRLVTAFTDRSQDILSKGFSLVGICTLDLFYNTINRLKDTFLMTPLSQVFLNYPCRPHSHGRKVMSSLRRQVSGRCPSDSETARCGATGRVVYTRTRLPSSINFHTTSL